MLQAQASERELIDQFLAALRSLPEVRAELEGPGAPELDAQLALDVAGKPIHALVELKRAVYPRDVRQLVWRIRDLARQQPAGESGGEPLAVLVAESISPGAKELLRAERVGYYDSGGSLYLPARGAYLYVDRPPPKSLSRSMRSLFTGRRAQVLHGLLVRHQDWFGVKDLAEQTLVSSATASQVLTEMERFDWLESRGQGPSKQRHLRQPAALLDAWAKQLGSIRAPALRRYFVPAMKPDGLMERLGQVCEARGVEYSVSFEAAAQRYAPFLSAVSQVRCRLLAGSGADAAIADLGARVVSEGANLSVIEAKSTGDLLFRERVGGVWLASPIHVYLDLLRGEGRAKEMADHLRKERIGFLMAKPATLDGYSDQYTLDCERVLVTLLRGLGPWKDSVYLVGGLTPRYLVPARPPVVPAHAGTLDVDIVIDLQILADTEAYHTLEENLKRMGFERAENEQGAKLSWRWQTRTEHGALMVLELLADAPQIAGGRVQPLPTEGTISALNIPHSSIVFDLYQVAEIRAELLGENGMATERVKHADIVSFTCLKAFAFDQRFERKDAHDLTYCIEHAPEGLDAVVAAFGRALAGKHAAVVRDALDVLRRRFADDGASEGYRKDGPVAVAKFEQGEGDEADQREARVLRQRQASDVIQQLLVRAV